MNRILFCAATREELEAVGLRDALPVEEGEKVCRLWQFPGEHASLAAVTGTGTPVTLLRLLPLLERYNPSLIINTGIAGAYRGSGLEIGDIVIGESEVFADLGMELPDDKGKDDDRHEGFYPLGEFPFADEALRAPLPLLIPPGWTKLELKRGRGATVNTCTGTEATGARRRRVFGVDFESMEGAAVALAGHERDIPVIEVRAISNHAATREGKQLRPENIRRALDALTLFWAGHRNGLLNAGAVV